MHYVWWGVFLVSLSLLIITVMRNKNTIQWLGYLGINIVISAVLLYVVNWVGAQYAYHIPINPTTIATVGLLGIPGLMLVIALKMTLV